VRVRRDDGVAIDISPEPCVAVREGGSEASVREHIGQPLSLAKFLIPGADAVAKVEGDTDGRASERECLDGPAWSKEPGMCGSSLRGNREIPRLTRTYLKIPDCCRSAINEE
jgi:hypothetical protein